MVSSSDSLDDLAFLRDLRVLREGCCYRRCRWNAVHSTAEPLASLLR